MEEKKIKRPSGRPKKTLEGGKQVTLYLNVRLAEKLKELGSSKWVTQKLIEEIEKSK